MHLRRKTRLIQRSILIVIIAVFSSRQTLAEKYTILVAQPQISSRVHPALTKDVSVYVRQGLTQLSVKAIYEDDVQDAMQRLSVSMLISRADSIKVARAVGAHALLRYKVLTQGKRVQISIAYYQIAQGKAVMLERSEHPGKLRLMVKKLLRELVEPTIAQTPKPEPRVQPKAPSAAAVTADPSTVSTARKPKKRRDRSFWWDPLRRAKSGIALGFHLGGSIPLGGGRHDELVGTGLRVGTHLGYQFQLAGRHALTPELAIYYSNWSWNSGTYIPDEYGNTYQVTDGGISAIHLMGGARYSVFIGPFSLFLALHAGLIHGTASVKNPDVGLDSEESKSGYGFNVELGSHYMFLPYLGAGIFIDVTKGFIESEELDTALLGLGIGISFKGKIPL